MLLCLWSDQAGLIKLWLRTATECGRIGRKRKVQLQLMKGVGVEWSEAATNS